MDKDQYKTDIVKSNIKGFKGDKTISFVIQDKNTNKFLSRLSGLQTGKFTPFIYWAEMFESFEDAHDQIEIFLSFKTHKITMITIELCDDYA